MRLTDTSLFPFGKFKGKLMQDVPVQYLHWVWHNTNATPGNGEDVHTYIKENIDALKLENKDLIWMK